MKISSLRMTKQRKVILDELRKVSSHPSADEIYEMVRKRLPRISLGTVYRNLEVLTDMGEIQTLELAGTLRRYDGNPEPHYHVRCIRCDLIEDSPIVLIPDLEKNLISPAGFKILGHRLEFLGLCEKCAVGIAVKTSEKALLL